MQIFLILDLILQFHDLPQITKNPINSIQTRSINHQEMQLRCFLFHILILQILYRLLCAINSVSAICEFSITQKNKVYSYNLASSSQSFPHGVLNEDGYFLNHSLPTTIMFNLCRFYDYGIFNIV